MLSMSWVLYGSVIDELNEESFGLVTGMTGLEDAGVEASIFGKGERGRGGEGPYRRRVSYWGGYVSAMFNFGSGRVVC
jgi:hypothetical protein